MVIYLFIYLFLFALLKLVSDRSFCSSYWIWYISLQCKCKRVWWPPSQWLVTHIS